MLSIGAGSNATNPSIGKYAENSSNFYDIYNNTSISDYSNSKIYFGGGGNFGYGYIIESKTLSRNVYSCGLGTAGPLGHGNINSCNFPTPIDALAYSNIVAISAGNNHSLFLAKNGNVYSCGSDNDGQLGRTSYYNYNIPMQITETIGYLNIVAISTGSRHSLFLDENGNVYSCGNKNQSQLGRTEKDNDIPIQITTTIGSSNIVAISAGGSHSLFLDINGNVYSCGRYDYGQLGREVWYDAYKPLQITETIDNSNIVAISAGFFHSLFLDDNGKVYSCGYGGYGQLGHGNITSCNFPTPIDALAYSNIVAISAGNQHSLFLAKNGNVYSCGRYTYDQLGRTVEDYNYNIPIQITETIGNSNIVAISAGSFHSLFLAENGNVYSCGTGGTYNYGQLGHGEHTNNCNFPTLIDALVDSNIVAISASGYHSLFISADIVTETELLSSTSLGGGGDAVVNGSSPGKSLSGGGGSGGAINSLGGKGGSGIVLLKYNTGYYYPDQYYCNLTPPFYQELTVTASNIYGANTYTLRFVRLGYDSLTVPGLINDKVSNIYLSQDEVTCNVGRTFSIEYNPPPLYENLDTVDCNLIITNTTNGNIYDIIINLGDNINNIIRITESETV